MKLRLAQLKAIPIKGDLEANSQRLMRLLDEVAPHQPDVVITPECFLDGYVVTEDHVTSENLRGYAVDPATSRLTQQVAAWAKHHHAWVVLGAARAAPEGVYNSALLYNRAGEPAGIYNKVHCRGHDRKFVAGRDLPVFGSDFGLFGVVICADRRWPETVRALALRGARIIFNPTYGNYGEMNNCLMRTRSFENEIFIAFTHPAQALVTGPRGHIVADHMSLNRAWAITEIDLVEVDEKRASEKSFLATRRPDVYGNPFV